MPTIERINSLYDVPSITKENQTLITQLQSMLSTMEKVQGGIQKVASSKGGTGLAVSTDLLTQSQVKLQSEVEMTNKVLQEHLNAVKATGTAVNDLNRIEAQAAISATEYGKSVNQSTRKIKENTQANKEFIVTEKEKALALAQDRYQSQQLNAALKNQVREELAAKGSIEQRRAALIRLAKAYDNLSAAERAAPQGQRLQGVVAGLTAQVKQLEADTGRAQRNVGNYGNAFVKAGKAAFGTLRTLANILPGVGISGLLLFAVEPIYNFIKAMFKGSEALNNFAENYKNVNEVVKEANISAGKQIADLKILYTTATDANIPLKERTEAVKALQKEFPDYFGNIKTETILNGQATDAYNALKDSIIATARATAAKSKIDAIEAQRLDVFFQKQKLITKANNDAAKATAKTFSTIGAGGFAQGTSTQSQITTKAQAQFIIQKKLADDLREQDLIDVALAQQEEFLIKFVGQEAITKTIINHNKEQVKSVHEKNEKIVDEEAKLQSDVQKILAHSREVALKNQGFDQVELGTNQDALNKQRDLIIKNTTESVQRIVDSNDALYVEDLANLKKRFDAKELTYEEYNAEVERLQKEQARRELSNAIELTQALINNLKARGFNVVEFERSLNELKKKLYELDAKNTDDAEKKKQKSIDDTKKAQEEAAKKKKELQEKEIELAKEVAELLITLAVSSIENQKNALADLQAKRDDDYNRQLENIRNSSLSEQDKAAETTQLQAAQAANAKKYAEQQRQLDIKKARFDRLTSIAGVIENTARAVVSALPNIPLSIVIGAIGAIQLAKILATPIAKYAKGTESAKRGFAWIGEQGTELMQDKRGNYSITPHKPTLTWLEGGEKITPHHKLSETLPQIAMRKPLYVASKSNGMEQFSSSMSDAISFQTYQLKKALSKKTKFVVNNNISIDKVDYLNKKVYNR